MCVWGVCVGLCMVMCSVILCGTEVKVGMGVGNRHTRFVWQGSSGVNQMSNCLRMPYDHQIWL